jgi:NAD(P)-dependent dehydrogenase (short-subunit alcohol dehydrogenase family)
MRQLPSGARGNPAASAARGTRGVKYGRHSPGRHARRSRNGAHRRAELPQSIYRRHAWARVRIRSSKRVPFEAREYDPWIAYGQSKTANALFAVALDSIGRRDGVRAFSVHPGGIVTPLIRHMSQAQIDASGIIDKGGKPVIDPQNNKKTPQQGAATSVGCATSPRLDGMGGVYCADCEIARALPSDDSTEMHGVSPRATDPVAAGRLWQLSEQLVGARID